MTNRPSIAACILLSVLAVSTVAVCAEPPGFEKDFDNADALQGLTLSGDVSVDTSKDRGGAKGLEAADVAPAGQKKGGALRLGPEAKRSGRCARRMERASWSCGSTRTRRNPRTPGITGPGRCGA